MRSISLGAFLDRKGLSIAGLVLLAILLVAINSLSSRTVRGLSLDLTEDGLFTLSDGTRRILGRLDEPLTLRLFYSESLGKSVPSYALYEARVRELLERYADLAGGMLKLEFYNPEPFSDEEDLAVAFGLQGAPVAEDGDLSYFGLAGTNSTDDEEKIAFFRPGREQFLEYDLTRLVANLANPDKKTIGVMSTLPLLGTVSLSGAARPPWTITTQMRQRFDVTEVAIDAAEIPSDIDVLMLVNPKGLSAATLYAIDQYVLRGGKLVAFVDPLSEADRRPAPPGPAPAGLARLLAAWGVEVPADTVIGDRDAATRVTLAGSGQMEVIEYLAWLSLDRRNFNPTNTVTGDLSSMLLASAGSIRTAPGATTEVTPLIISGPATMEIDTKKLRPVPDFKGLLAAFVPADRTFVLAAAIRGPAKTAFPDGPPAATTGGETTDTETPGDAGAPGAAPPLADSAGPINVILVADSDLLDDRFWVQVQNFFGRRVATPTSDNGDFVFNALDYMSGSDELIGLRSRGRLRRPFELVRQIEAKAELRYRAKEKELRDRLAEVEGKLSELRTKSKPGDRLILTPEQRDEIAKLEDAMLVTRKELRQVQHALRANINRLEAWLKVVNIGLMPALVGLTATGSVWWRRRRRKRRRPAD